MDDKVSAKCGKLLKPQSLRLHESLCLKCKELASGQASQAMSAEKISEIPPEKVADISTETSLPLPQPQTISEEAIVNKVVSILGPEIQKAIQGKPPEAPVQTLTAEEQKAVIEEAVKKTILEMVEAQKKAQQPGENGKDGQNAKPPAGTDLAALAGIANAFAPLIAAFRSGGAGKSDLEQFQKVMEFANGLAAHQVEIFRSGSDFASSLISTATKLKAEPGEAADLVRGNSSKILPRMEPNK